MERGKKRKASKETEERWHKIDEEKESKTYRKMTVTEIQTFLSHLSMKSEVPEM